MADCILNNEYDFIFGIGEACSCSETLRKCGLQFQSYPLDWLYGGDIKTRVNLLVNNFEDFINIDDLQKQGERENPLPCDIYANLKNKIVFNHDFPLRKNLDETYPLVFEKYNRRIKRLYENIENSNKILIVYIQNPASKTKIIRIIRKIKFVIQLISKKFPNKEINLLYIANKNFFLPFKLKFKIGKNSLLYITNYKRKDNTLPEFIVNPDVLNRIFKNVKLNKNVIKNHEQKAWVMQ